MPTQLTSIKAIYKPIALVFIFLCVLGFFLFPSTSTLPLQLPPKNGIIHIVMFEFKPEASQSDIKAACDRMLSLKSDCLHPTTKKPYVKSILGGKDNSPEGLQNGITHSFVVEFERDEDRKFYLESDPAHLGFVKSVGDIVARAQVVDFSPGVFE